MNAEPVARTQRCIAVLWPSFLLAGLATTLFFVAFDPEEVLACVGGPALSRLGAYSIGFFFFWSLTAASSLLTCYFRRPCPGTTPGSTSGC